MASRPFGVRRALLWMFIRFSGRITELLQGQLLSVGPNGQRPDNSQLELSSIAAFILQLWHGENSGKSAPYQP
jgi:hypothetical protein